MLWAEPWLWMSAVFGALIGSFLNVCIVRIPAKESIILPSSHCVRCQHPLSWRDNVPFVSWLWLRGRCRYCGGVISLQYPLIELVTLLLTVTVMMKFGVRFESFALLVLGYALIVLSAIDFQHTILPNVITYPGIVVGLTLTALPDIGPPFPAIWTDALLGTVAGGGLLWSVARIFEHVTGKIGMGMGDVKLLAMIGAWLGWQSLPLTLFLASLMGAFVGTLWILAGHSRHTPIPFGPWLAGAAWFYLFFGQSLYGWYWDL